MEKQPKNGKKLNLYFFPGIGSFSKPGENCYFSNSLCSSVSQAASLDPNPPQFG
jgi:hypothetical protein